VGQTTPATIDSMSNEPPRGTPSAVVAFWPCGDPAASAESLRTALDGAGADVPTVLPAGAVGERLLTQITAVERERVRLVEPSGASLAALVDAAGAGWAAADIAVVADAVALPPGWLRRLQTAVVDDTLLSTTFDDLATADRVEAVAGAPLPPQSERPFAVCAEVLLPAPGGCLLRRPALTLLGGLDPVFSDPHAALADLAARGRELALGVMLIADPVPARLAARVPCPAADAARLQRRHSWLAAAVRSESALDPGPLRQVLTRARVARGPISVTVDARSLTAGVGGTQTYVGALVLALAQADRVRTRAVCAPDLDDVAVAAFRSAGVDVVSYEEAATGTLPRTDIVHRPQQVFTPDDLRLLQLLGDRLVITQMDLIGCRAPGYHASIDAWQTFRRVTRLALATADIAVFFSEHARDEALLEQLISPERARLAGIGVDPIPLPSPASRPPAVPAGADLLVAIGADYAHKNRPFAIALADELRRRHGWDGLLVFAGPHVAHGSSADAERAVLAARPEMAARTIELGQVTEDEKRWLLHAATAQLACSTYEGFGLGPLESAAAGRPCVYPAQTSLRELIDPAAATVVPWDPQASAAAAAPLLRSGPERERHLELLRTALARHSWERVTDRLLDAYVAAVESPYRAAAPRSWAELEREELLVALDQARRDLEDRVRDGIALIDSAHPLLTDAERRGLIRVASRGWLKRPLLMPFGLVGTIRPDGRAPRRSDGEPPDPTP
jgi:glycosyltransferase involved in cell wall biosynthesis